MADENDKITRMRMEYGRKEGRKTNERDRGKRKINKKFRYKAFIH
jgi:hypothetical protein